MGTCNCICTYSPRFELGLGRTTYHWLPCAPPVCTHWYLRGPLYIDYIYMYMSCTSSFCYSACILIVSNSQFLIPPSSSCFTSLPCPCPSTFPQHCFLSSYPNTWNLIPHSFILNIDVDTRSIIDIWSSFHRIYYSSLAQILASVFLLSSFDHFPNPALSVLLTSPLINHLPTPFKAVVHAHAEQGPHLRRSQHGLLSVDVTVAIPWMLPSIHTC